MDYCYICKAWHEPKACLQHADHIRRERDEFRKWRRINRQLEGLSDEEFDRKYGDANA